MIVHLRVNGEDRAVDVAGTESLLSVLRDRLGLPGSKAACEQGECGSCAVVVNGTLACACLVMAVDAEAAEVTTIEGLAPPGELNPVQDALLEAGAVQCGFCTPGLAVAATQLYGTNPTPTVEEICEGLSGNLCRCTGYGAILRGLAGLSARNAAGRVS